MESKIRNYYKTNKVNMKMRIRAWRRKYFPSFNDVLYERACAYAQKCIESGNKKGYEKWLLYTPKELYRRGII